MSTCVDRSPADGMELVHSRAIFLQRQVQGWTLKCRTVFAFQVESCANVGNLTV